MQTRPISLARFPAILNHDDLCFILGEKKETVLAMCRRGDLPAKKIGKKWFAEKSIFIEWMQNFATSPNEMKILIKELREMIQASEIKALLEQLKEINGKDKFNILTEKLDKILEKLDNQQHIS